MKTIESTPETRATDSTTRTARRNGKIARLPKKLRQLVNQLLDDGVTYAQIVERLKQSNDPPLPYDISEKNISNWHDGGYQDWVAHHERMDLLASKLDLARDLAVQCHPDKLQELTLELATIRICEFLSRFAIDEPQANLPAYLRLLCALPRISKEAVRLEKTRLENLRTACHARPRADASNEPGVDPHLRPCSPPAELSKPTSDSHPSPPPANSSTADNPQTCAPSSSPNADPILLSVTDTFGHLQKPKTTPCALPRPLPSPAAHFQLISPPRNDRTERAATDNLAKPFSVANSRNRAND